MTKLDELLDLSNISKYPEDKEKFYSLKKEIEEKIEKYDRVFHGNNNVNKALELMTGDLINTEKENQQLKIDFNDLDSKHEEYRKYLEDVIKGLRTQITDYGNLIESLTKKIRTKSDEENERIVERLKIRRDICFRECFCNRNGKCIICNIESELESILKGDKE